MAKNINLTLLVICLLSLASSQSFYYHTKHVNLTQSCAQELMEEINEAYVESATAYRKFADDVLSPEILMREKLRPYYGTMQRFQGLSFNNTQLQRQFEVILRGVTYPPLNYAFKKATNTLKSMGKIKYVCDREHPPVANRKCHMAYIHQIKTIVTNSDDLDEIKWYWKEWRNRMPAEVKNALHYYIGYYQNMSTPAMPASAVWYDQYENANFLDVLEQLMETIRPFYRELHAHLRHALRVKYGESIVPATGLIPHHLLEQSLYQAWKKESVLRNPFPERKLPNVQQELDEMGYFPFDFVNISSQYFGSLGFDNLTDDFMRDHFIEMTPGAGGPDCKSRIFTYGEIELNYCPKVYYKKLLQSHGDVAQIQYAILKNKLNVGLNQEACPGFSNALGEAAILSASTPQYLQEKLGLLQSYEYDDILNLNRLYRMAVHTVLSIPTYFVHEKLWVDMIDGKVKPEEYSCHYWNLMEKYMGVSPSEETQADAYDMPYKFYEGIVDQYRSTRKLFGEFLGYQIYRAICLKTRQYERGNAYKNLHNCDFSKNKHAGQLLKDMMSAGSTKSWREIIKPLTPRNSTKLSGTAFLEYFEPLHTWLADDNVDKSIHVGWMPIDKCSRSTGVETQMFDESETFSIKTRENTTKDGATVCL